MPKFSVFFNNDGSQSHTATDHETAVEVAKNCVTSGGHPAAWASVAEADNDGRVVKSGRRTFIAPIPGKPS